MTASPSGALTPPLLGTVDRAAGAVRLERTLPAPPQQAWEALTDPARLPAWLAPLHEGAPGPGRSFVLRMNDRETATCTVTAWDPPRELRLVWDYTGEGPSELSFSLAEQGEPGGQTRLVLEHRRIPGDAVQYGAGWHVHLDLLADALAGPAGSAGPTGSAEPSYGLDDGCDDDRFLAAYQALEPRYAAAATG